MARSARTAIAVTGLVLAASCVAFADLVLDQGFSGDGTVTADFGPESDSARDLAVAADGSYYLAGLARVGGEDRLAVLHLDGNGAVVEGFGDGGWATAVPRQGNQTRGETDGRAVAIQPPEGRVVVAALWSDQGGERHVLVARFETDGDLDATFGSEGMAVVDLPGLVEPFTTAMAIDSQGRILVGGYMTPVDERSQAFVVRLEPDGSPDPFFAAGGLSLLPPEDEGYDATVRAICLLEGDDMIVVGGRDNAEVFKLLESGFPDQDFADLGRRRIAGQDEDTLFDGLSCGLQPDGKILVGLTRSDSRDSWSIVARLTPQGEFDGKFGDGALLEVADSGDGPGTIAVRKGGDFVVAGDSLSPRHISREGTLQSTIEEPPVDFQWARRLVALDGGAVIGAGDNGLGAFAAFRVDVEPLECGACGELNGDCKFTVADALLALRMAVGQSPPVLLADMDGGGSVTAGDALAILRVAVGILLPFEPCPAP